MFTFFHSIGCEMQKIVDLYSLLSNHRELQAFQNNIKNILEYNINQIKLSKLDLFLSLKSFFTQDFLLKKAEVAFYKNDIKCTI